MATVYGAYLSPLARDIQVVMLESEASWKRIEAMEYIMEASTQSAYLEAERDVLRRGGFVDDFESAYLMIESENEEKSDGLLVSIAKAISGMLKGLVDALTGAFKSGEIKKACNENTEIELSEKKAGVLQKLPGIWTGAKAILSGIFDKLFKNEDGNFDPASTIRTGIIAAAGLGIWAKGKGENTKVEDDGKTKIYKGNVVENMISGLRSTLEDIEKFFDDVSLKYQQSVGKNAATRKLKEIEKDKEKKSEAGNEGAATNESVYIDDSDGVFFEGTLNATIDKTNIAASTSQLLSLSTQPIYKGKDGKASQPLEAQLTKLRNVYKSMTDEEKKAQPGANETNFKTIETNIENLRKVDKTPEELKKEQADAAAKAERNKARTQRVQAKVDAAKRANVEAHAGRKSTQAPTNLQGNELNMDEVSRKVTEDLGNLDTLIDNSIALISSPKSNVSMKRKEYNYNKALKGLNNIKNYIATAKMHGQINNTLRKELLEKVQPYADRVNELDPKNPKTPNQGTNTPQQPAQGSQQPQPSGSATPGTQQPAQGSQQQQTPSNAESQQSTNTWSSRRQQSAQRTGSNQSSGQQTAQTAGDDSIKALGSRNAYRAKITEIFNNWKNTFRDQSMSEKDKTEKYKQYISQLNSWKNRIQSDKLHPNDKKSLIKQIDDNISQITNNMSSAGSNGGNQSPQSQPTNSGQQSGSGSQAPEGGQQPSESGSNAQNENPDKPAESEANDEEESDEKSGGDKEDTRSSKEKAIDQKSLNEKLKPSVMDKIKGAWDAFKEAISLIATGLADVISKVPGLGGVVDRIRGKKLEGDDKKDDKADGKEDDKVPDDNGENGAAQAEPQAAEGQEGTANASANPILQGLFGINDSDLEVINESYDEDLETLDALFSMI